MRRFELDVVVTRGRGVESTHQVHAAVVDGDGALVGAAGDPTTRTYWRSCAKPFQLMPFVAEGGAERLRWGDEELALACASHGGEPEHVELAARMLADIDLGAQDLVCGPHEPMSERGARLLRASGGRPTRLHNNCSGKHAAMLARARLNGWPTADYARAEHPVQQDALATVAAWARLAPAAIDLAVDGCGVVVFGLPLAAMAGAYGRFGVAVGAGEEAPARIGRAIGGRPVLFGGTDRFDSIVVEETGGRVITKVGAEGVHSAALLDLGVGAVVKVADGATRAQYPAMLRLLQMLGGLPEALPARLAGYLRAEVRNTRNEVVGAVMPRADYAAR